MDKSPDAFRTISEVADDLDLPQHVLRFWETRFSQIKPLKRGGGRRYYRPTDVDLLNGIRHLLYDQGYTIKGVQKILRENGVQFVVAIGAGDADALEQMAQKAAEPATVAEEPKPKPAAKTKAGTEAGDDILVGQARPKNRAIFNLGRAAGVGEKAQAVPLSTPELSGENRALLQEALFDLLECKRLLDQTR
ncbi:MAG: MerR family transcriptional regulator [Pseudomonadota bacterium]